MTSIAGLLFPPTHMVRKENHLLKTLKTDIFYPDLLNDETRLSSSEFEFFY